MDKIFLDQNFFGPDLFVTQIFFGSNTFRSNVFWTWIFFNQNIFTKLTTTITTTTTKTLMGFDTIEINLVGTFSWTWFYLFFVWYLSLKGRKKIHEFLFEKMSPREPLASTWFGDILKIGMHFLVESSHIHYRGSYSYLWSWDNPPSYQAVPS